MYDSTLEEETPENCMVICAFVYVHYTYCVYMLLQHDSTEVQRVQFKKTLIGKS